MLQDNHHSHGSHSPIPTSPVAQRRLTNTSSNIDIKTFANEHGNNFLLGLNDNRPRSSCGLSRLPGIKYVTQLIKIQCSLNNFNDALGFYFRLSKSIIEAEICETKL